MKINKGQFTLSTPLQWLKFNLGRGRGHFVRYLTNRFRWHIYPRLGRVSRFPDHVDIELSSACDMVCPMCYTVSDDFKKMVTHKNIDPDLFRKIVDECAHYGTYSIRLSFRGEPFLHRKIVELTRYAKEKGIKEVSTLTNGLRLNPTQFEEMLDAGLDWLTISFDGVGETYEKIRRPAKFDEAVEKIRTYKAIKERRGSAKPVIKVQTVWPAIKDDPQAFYDLFEPIVDQVSTNPLMDYLHLDTDIEYEEGFSCPVLYQRLVIGSDGKVLLCINDELGRHIVGDVNTQSLYEIWHGERLTEARAIHRQRRGVELLTPCKACHLPRKTEVRRFEVDGRVIQLEAYTKRTEVIGQ
ncbi:radical SAM protein [Nitrospinae bacterium AH_259_B05_G02_I21]|nr:radical SAM protein [Nitrospinae bacterium AH_259_B05_G02_I21]MDA2931661.1 radical SAM protein [Nitrospinae bacterium AH-259-F20]